MPSPAPSLLEVPLGEEAVSEEREDEADVQGLTRVYIDVITFCGIRWVVAGSQ